MRFLLDHDADSPLYAQIEEHFRKGIMSGILGADTRLPATRRLASELGVNRITVENAYANLEAEGLLYARVGAGTYVAQQAPLLPLPNADSSPQWPSWQMEMAASQEPSRRAAIEESLRQSGHPNPINFAGGIGDPSLFPADDYRKALHKVLRRDGIQAFNYGDRSGYAPLRESIAQVLAAQGFRARADNVLVTAGSQQALALVSQVLLKPGQAVLVEEPTYAGALDLFRALGLQIYGVPVDERGMQVEAVEVLLNRHHPGLIYTIPNFHNPTGACLSLPRRRHLLALADRYNVPILEDDFVGDLRYDGRSQPALKSLDPGGRVIYVSTFSKMVMPGLRVGFLVAEGPVYQSLVNFKRVTDLASSSLHQRALQMYVTVGRYQANLRRSCQLYRRRRDAMLAAIHRHLPGSVHLDVPQGGLFLWLKLQQGFSSEALLPAAIEEGVAYSPGSLFFLSTGAGDRFIRLNFSAYKPEEIESGIRRLGAVMKRMEPFKLSTNPTLHKSSARR